LHTDEEGTFEAGAFGHGNGIDIAPCASGLLQGFVDDGLEILEVRTGCQFGDDTTISCVKGKLAGDYIRTNHDGFIFCLDDGGTRIITRAFYSQDKGH
jgi:hypothetical protein